MIDRRRLIQGVAAGALLPLAGGVARALAQSAPATAAPAQPTLGAIRALTHTAPSLPEVERAWTQFMGYRLIARGKLPAPAAKSWNAPALAGKPYIIIGPASGEPTYIRFVEQPAAQDAAEADTYGWRAIEITVQNSDELYEKLKDSPFVVRGPPSLVPTYPYLKALGARGPAGERLNLTWITERRPDLAVAESFVGRCFIATQTTPDLPAALEWYKSTFGNVASPIRRLPTMQLSVVTLKEGAKIEIDQHGPNGRRREPAIPGGLPGGLAVVSFECTSFDQHSPAFLVKPTKNRLEPFRDRRVATLRGPAGELIELIES
ncbi:MAG TPA: VOC family protein [Steroidobacteraceae bacterium]|nr:VOC family protein [Steroidobacteraceae bacterium]